MKQRFSTLRTLLYCLGLILFSFFAHAQIEITTPLERAVYQRNADGSAEVIVSGSFTVPMDEIDIRAIPVAPGQGREIAWTRLQEKPSGGVFSGPLRIQGGWYSLEVRGLKAGVQIGETKKVTRVGVGEVLIISGQSNAQGMVDHSISTAPPPGANEDRVNYVSYNNEIGNFITDLPPPVFKQLNSFEDVMGLRGHGSWCWGVLGDLLVQKLNVPVMFVNTGWDGTSIRNWWQSSQGQRTYSVYAAGVPPFPDQMPYANLRLSVQHYARQYGVRAVLWMQGESDNNPLNMSVDEYRNTLKALIGKLSSDVNRQISWMIARTSYYNYRSNANITAAQNAVISDLKGIAFAGPDTDNLPVQRPDGTHFFGYSNLVTLANAWSDALSTNFFSSAAPLAVTPEPAIVSVCASSNTALNLSLPAGFVSYSWQKENNGSFSDIGQYQRTVTITSAGTYSAKVKDANGNTLRAQKMIVSASIKPATPTIAQTGTRQICTDSVYTFAVNTGSDTFNWYKLGDPVSIQEGPTLDAREPGDYFVRSQNVYGCNSDNSVASSLIVRPRLPTPVVEKTGPFTATATILQTGLNESYEWQRGETILLTSNTSSVKTDQTGEYSARTRVSYTIGTNILQCVSPFSNTLQVQTEGESDIVVFPNPASRNGVFVESRDDLDDAEIIVYDLNGREMVTQKQDMKSRVRIRVRNLSAGKYIVRIRSGDVDVRKQLVVN